MTYAYENAYRDDSCMQKKNHSFWSTLNIHFKFQVFINKKNQSTTDLFYSKSNYM